MKKFLNHNHKSFFHKDLLFHFFFFFLLKRSLFSPLLFSCLVVSDSFAISGTVAHKAPLSFGLSQQGYWSGLPFPPLGGFPNPGLNPASHESPELSGRFFTIEPPGKP